MTVPQPRCWIRLPGVWILRGCGVVRLSRSSWELVDAICTRKSLASDYGNERGAKPRGLSRLASRMASASLRRGCTGKDVQVSLSDSPGPCKTSSEARTFQVLGIVGNARTDKKGEILQTSDHVFPFTRINILGSSQSLGQFGSIRALNQLLFWGVVGRVCGT